MLGLCPCLIRGRPPLVGDAGLLTYRHCHVIPKSLWADPLRASMGFLGVRTGQLHFFFFPNMKEFKQAGNLPSLILTHVKIRMCNWRGRVVPCATALEPETGGCCGGWRGRAVKADAWVLYIRMGAASSCSCLCSVDSLNPCGITLSVGNSRKSHPLYSLLLGHVPICLKTGLWILACKTVLQKTTTAVYFRKPFSLLRYNQLGDSCLLIAIKLLL